MRRQRTLVAPGASFMCTRAPKEAARAWMSTPLASGWYEGRLDRGYRRRDPAEAKDLFRAAGLEGPFWGL